MSNYRINQYYKDIDKQLPFCNSKDGGTLRFEFLRLLNHYADKYELLVLDRSIKRGLEKKQTWPDGELKNILKETLGHWQNEEVYDDLDKEIKKKKKEGYPFTNILFENSKVAVLFQDGEEIMRIDIRKPSKLHHIISAFMEYH